MAMLKILPEYIRRNKRIVIFLFCVIFGISLCANLYHVFTNPEKPLGGNIHLGAEYYFIAKAIASGKGFSNPFKVNTGPTAWMPPLYPFFLAFLIKLLQKRLLIACVVVFLKNIVLIFNGLVIYEIAKRTLTKIRAEYILVLYIVWLLTDFLSFFLFTHDSWLLLLFICSIFLLTVFIKRNIIDLKTAIIWGVVGGLSVLTSPIVGLVWLIICLFVVLAGRNVKLLLLSSALFFLFCSPWIVRNYLVFDKLIFMKSNLFFDAHFANCEKDDGLIDSPFFSDNHPVWNANKDPNSLYRKLGEIKFLETYKKEFLSEINKNPYTYMRKIKNRLFAALVIYYPFFEDEKFIAWKTIIHALPFVCIIFIIILKGYTGSDYIKIAMLIYGVYLLPYILIIYYLRYGIPLTPLKVLFTFWGIDLLITRWPKLFTKRSTQIQHPPKQLQR